MLSPKIVKDKYNALLSPYKTHPDAQKKSGEGTCFWTYWEFSPGHCPKIRNR